MAKGFSPRKRHHKLILFSLTGLQKIPHRSWKASFDATYKGTRLQPTTYHDAVSWLGWKFLPVLKILMLPTSRDPYKVTMSYSGKSCPTSGPKDDMHTAAFLLQQPWGARRRAPRHTVPAVPSVDSPGRQWLLHSVPSFADDLGCFWNTPGRCFPARTEPRLRMRWSRCLLSLSCHRWRASGAASSVSARASAQQKRSAEASRAPGLWSSERSSTSLPGCPCGAVLFPGYGAFGHRCDSFRTDVSVVARERGLLGPEFREPRPPRSLVSLPPFDFQARGVLRWAVIGKRCRIHRLEMVNMNIMQSSSRKFL